MIDLNSLQKKFPSTEKKVKIEAWDGEVRIKRLTLAETNNFMRVQQEDGMIAGMVEAVASCLVEPQITVQELSGLNEEAFKGIDEIFKSLNEFSETKK